MVFPVAMAALMFNSVHGQNLVLNPGFEDGTDGWFWYANPLTATSINAHSGNACGTVAISAYGSGAGQIMLGRLQAGQTYTWSAWMRSDAAPRTVRMNLTQADSAGNLVTPVATNTLGITWSRFTTTFNLSVTGAPTYLSVSFQAWNAPLTLYLDDVSITNSSPVVGIVRTNESVFLSWPVSAASYTLQSTTNLVAPVNWLAVAIPLQTNAGVISATLPSPEPSRFFRLQRP